MMMIIHLAVDGGLTCCIGLLKPVGFCGLTYIITTVKKILCGHLAIYKIVCLPNGGGGGGGGEGGGEEVRFDAGLKIHFPITSLSIHFFHHFFFFEVNEPVGINTPRHLSVFSILPFFSYTTHFHIHLPSSPS